MFDLDFKNLYTFVQILYNLNLRFCLVFFSIRYREKFMSMKERERKRDMKNFIN